MLQICSNVLLLATDQALIKDLQSMAGACGSRLRVETDWNAAYRVNAECIITDSSYLEYINESYYGIITLILGKDETFMPYKDKISSFIFNKDDPRELMFAFLKEEKVFVHCNSEDITSIMKHSNVTSYIQGDYNFNFEFNSFVWKGKRLYISESQQAYLAEWLINGHKDNKKRMALYSMRQKFGKDFLADVDRFGQWKGGKDELCTI